MSRFDGRAQGATIQDDGSTLFRIWAPHRRQVHVVVEPLAREFPLHPEGDGYFAGQATGLSAGTQYRFRLDELSTLFPDPASRFQPDGPHGASEIVDPREFRWTDSNWKGVTLSGAVIYEMHIGTFTADGTWTAAAEKLQGLADLGITILEILPIADFPGRFGWGYDGVSLFAPTRLYGKPDDARLFVDRAHSLGLGVILDVVYNHFGPDGNYLKNFAPEYFTDKYRCEWGEAINFDGPNSGPVREFFLTNAEYWIREFHFDGLRLDATQQIFDDSSEHILAAIVRRARAAAGERQIVIVAENEPQETRLIRTPEHGGYGIDALWNDDFHHSARVALTGQNPAYYSGFLGKPQELVSAVKWGFLYQGQTYSWQKKSRGTSTRGLRSEQFVTFLQNHDQVANSGAGLRGHQLASAGRWRALTALLLLGPGTPMLFQGQEFAASSPFLYFADHNADLAPKIAQGRAEFLSQFPELASTEGRATLADPADPRTFERCRLDDVERALNPESIDFHRDLLKLRRSDPVFGNSHPRDFDGAVLGGSAFAIRFFAADGVDRLLLINLGPVLYLTPIPEPLLAPPEDCRWSVLWSSDDIRYGGEGVAVIETSEGWQLPGESAIVLSPMAVNHEQ